jgi:hypothetical protein
MESMAAFRNDVRLLAGQAKAKAKGLETDWALVLFFCILLVGDDGERGDVHDRVRMGGRTVAGGGCGSGGAINGAQRGNSCAGAVEDGRKRKSLRRRSRGLARLGVGRRKGS